MRRERKQLTSCTNEYESSEYLTRTSFTTYLAVGEADGVADGLDDGLLVGEELGVSGG